MEKKNNIIAIPDLERKIEESLFDAVNYFDKKCPYCDTNLYDGHIRDKIEVDHYIPIFLGGQHVPWNVLPCCKKCNRKKKNVHPNIFLNNQLQRKCEIFLDNVRTKITDSVQIDIDAAQQAKVFIKDKLQNALSYETKNILLELSKIFQLKMGENCSETTIKFSEDTIENFLNSECVLGIQFSISKEALYQRYKDYCISNKIHLQIKPQFFRNLFSLTKEVLSFRPNIHGNRQWWLKGIKLKE